MNVIKTRFKTHDFLMADNDIFVLKPPGADSMLITQSHHIKS